jgi:monoterpene epsilon-lactone hydrolase
MDPLIRRSLDRWSAAVPDDPTIPNWRLAVEQMHAEFGTHDDAVVTRFDADGVPVIRVEAPGASRERVIIHFHSGGYVMGSAESYQEFGYRLSAVTGRAVLIVEYRLAPENPYPAPVEDALTSYRWLSEQVGARNIVVSGDSAGGGLALALVVALRDAGDELPSAVSVHSPLTDLAAEGASYAPNRDTDPVVNYELAVGMGAVYIGDRDPKQTPLASPLYADFTGFPPLLVQASSSEALLDDSVRLVDRVVAAGGSARLLTYPDVPHVWHVFPYLEESTAALDAVASFLDSTVPVP